jgi:hypothetical protein
MSPVESDSEVGCLGIDRQWRIDSVNGSVNRSGISITPPPPVMWLCHKYFLGTNELSYLRFLSTDSKEFFNKLRLRHTVPLANSIDLSFANHTHGFNPAQGSSRGVE